jgi:murein DD-endopeptidase MepM/ murein hydrolase activator NlpD
MSLRRWMLFIILSALLALTLRFCVIIVPSEAPPRSSGPQRNPFAKAGPPVPPLLIPVAGVARSALADSFEQSREAGGRIHDAIDIAAPRGTTVIAAARGKIEKIFKSARGGQTMYIRSPDGQWIYYYAHLDGYAPAVREGMVVEAGDALGTVGSTGNAQADAPHLHFAVNRMRSGEQWYQGTPVNPYPILAGER